MMKLSAFADEIDPSLEKQIEVCRETGVAHIEMRGVRGQNVLKFDRDFRSEVRKKLRDAGIGVVSIASPCGKQPVDRPTNELIDQFRIAAELADYFSAPFIRVFSFYPPGGEGHGPVAPHRERVVELLQRQCQVLDMSGAIMVHENEKGIFGDTGARCLDLLKSVNSPKLRAAFDPANFVQVGEDPLACWEMLKPYTVHFHIKDARRDTGQVVRAGEGDGGIAEILRDANAAEYEGFLSLEPHLKVAGHSHGETGPDLFRSAATALRDLCRREGIALAS